ncbi:MAG TPA: hypothetical protein VGV17_15940 [Bosea sp. (in: a-proteobacteria)]|jgi:hypothetical protein|uniref:hypothetical protein n=1 Tax=Bosea sp. (in: a-proteobacteria) TaxID=1871050 RepID=UPI002DDD4F73|nr:hypothetical protein [Bosea sp. (in: a-proteobacteria)]HEV2555246.1 hypothetical protein [Bosea sp. (in: a-proteobacteria)]
MDNLGKMLDEDRQREVREIRRMKRRSGTLVAAAFLSPFAAAWLGLPELGPYAFAFLLVVGYAVMVDHSIDAAERRARGY